MHGSAANVILLVVEQITVCPAFLLWIALAVLQVFQMAFERGRDLPLAHPRGPYMFAFHNHGCLSIDIMVNIVLKVKRLLWLEQAFIYVHRRNIGDRIPLKQLLGVLTPEFLKTF